MLYGKYNDDDDIADMGEREVRHNQKIICWAKKIKRFRWIKLDDNNYDHLDI